VTLRAFAPFLLWAVLVLLALPSMVGPTRVDGWPNLWVVEHVVPTMKEVGDACAADARPGCTVLACALFDFDAGECHIWVADETPTHLGLLTHERWHCAGYDHWWTPPGCGGKSMERLLREWRERRP
jgi:hypothetical protein